MALTPNGVSAGDTAWMLVATALVLMMTPVLGLFYSGLVRGKSALNTFMMSIAALAVVTVTWTLVGFTLAFDPGGSFVGGFRYVLPLRVSERQEALGMDVVEHGEEAYAAGEGAILVMHDGEHEAAVADVTR